MHTYCRVPQIGFQRYGPELTPDRDPDTVVERARVYVSCESDSVTA